ncbi:MATE family efflux transporter [Enterocloster clostridioformis]|uniref:MATE family efflux transporter n=1 Tax=Enterocloster clostridioformis TaxID=1531 RepID=UPI00080C8057|nr:MATE family efflux transporter [Enterocloster clostridioformis]ANU47244.1 MATE family efflux transporter [Lachnoclostridium sp. YL32]NDO31001.1 MATE family efflux transporter [Enterocloster clostridioformis]OXE66436.1 MATE family efflux transporter [Enterocloster clostridioformis]QQR03737.1 MATE family efflux transporter [Enterocloster clostridioformis]
MNQNNDRISIMKDAPIAGALMKLGIPTMVGMLISALYNAIDAYFVGGLGLSQMGAVSVVFPIVQIIIGLGMMFGAGASSYISRSLGKGDNETANKTASTALFSSILVGAVIIIGIMLFLDPVLTSLGATATILPYARAYARIYVTGSIINVFTVTMNNLLTAQGATRFTMISMLTGSIINVILDPIMIYGLDWGIEGAAIATIISLCISMILYIGYIARKQGVLRFSLRNISFSGKIYVEILKIGIPVLLFQLLSSASMSLTNNAAKPYGDYAVAAMGAVTRIMTVGTYVVFGFLKGFQPFAGYNYGAKQFDRLRKAIKLCMIWSTAFGVVAAILLTVFAEPMVSLFGTDAEMVALASRALRLNAVLFITFGFQMVYATLYLAIGKSAVGGLLSLSKQGIFFIPLIYVLPRLWELNGLVCVQPMADLLTTIVTAIFAIRITRSLSAVKTE